MNSKGQAFSTFQLLISAIVALAILVLLLGILDIIPGINQKKMSSDAGDFITTQITKPSELRTSGTPLTVESGDTLNAKALAMATGVLSESQICLSKGDLEEDASFAFSDEEGTILRYSGSQTRIKISVLCDVGNEIESDLQRNGITNSWMTSAQCQSVSQLEQSACIVALRFA